MPLYKMAHQYCILTNSTQGSIFLHTLPVHFPSPYNVGHLHRSEVASYGNFALCFPNINVSRCLLIIYIYILWIIVY